MRTLPILAVLLLCAAPPRAAAQRAPQGSRAGRLPRLVVPRPAPSPRPHVPARPHAPRGVLLVPVGLWPYWAWSVSADETPVASAPPVPARVPPTRVIDVAAEARAAAERERSAYAGVVLVGPTQAAAPRP